MYDLLAKRICDVSFVEAEGASCDNEWNEADSLMTSSCEPSESFAARHDR